MNFIFALCMKSAYFIKTASCGKRMRTYRVLVFFYAFFFLNERQKEAQESVRDTIPAHHFHNTSIIAIHIYTCFCSAYFSSKSFSKAVSILEINYSVSSFSVFKIYLMAIPSSLLWENVVLIHTLNLHNEINYKTPIYSDTMSFGAVLSFYPDENKQIRFAFTI